MDNGPEFISLKLVEWASLNDIELEFIKFHNSYIERFSRNYRDAILNMYVFKILNEVRDVTETWLGNITMNGYMTR